MSKKKFVITDTKRQIVDELFKPVRRNFNRRKTIVKGFDDLWQSDIADMQNYSRQNQGYRYILVAIDSFSKFLWTKPLKSKSAEDVTQAMKSILKEERTPKNLQTDQGLEYFNRKFQGLMQQYGINHYNTYSIKKAAMAERVIRTLKSMLFKTFILTASHKWKDKLKDVTLEYNNTIHSTTKMKPNDVSKSSEQVLLSTIYRRQPIPHKTKFSEGDYVRISREKYLFEKGFTSNYTAEIFKITRVNQTNPRTYVLEDVNGQQIQGCFYEQELQKCKHPDVYLIEKVLRRKGSKLRVRWFGLPSTQDSWIKRSDLR